VATITQLVTRRQEPFLKVALEDISGSVEVMVWTKLYKSTRELWQEGKILLVGGKVRLRDDRVQLSGDIAELYQPEAAQSEEVATPEPAEVPPIAEETKAEPAPTQSRRLVISISQTSDEAGDIAQLYKLVDTLRQFPGQDEVNLCVANGDKIFRLKLSNVTTNYCPELHKRLVELLGEDGVRLEERV
jgi:DNA polymerase-3 subunit alpha